jgi:hypothetical protein
MIQNIRTTKYYFLSYVVVLANERIAPASVTRRDPGRYLVDFGKFDIKF